MGRKCWFTGNDVDAFHIVAHNGLKEVGVAALFQELLVDIVLPTDELDQIFVCREAASLCKPSDRRW
jgi:hypothetical protein